VIISPRRPVGEEVQRFARPNVQPHVSEKLLAHPGCSSFTAEAGPVEVLFVLPILVCLLAIVNHLRGASCVVALIIYWVWLYSR